MYHSQCDAVRELNRVDQMHLESRRITYLRGSLPTQETSRYPELDNGVTVRHSHHYGQRYNVPTGSCHAAR